jgi:hypothetical protein
MKLCACGCGQAVKNESNMFIHHHNTRIPEVRAKVSTSIKRLWSNSNYKQKVCFSQQSRWDNMPVSQRKKIGKKISISKNKENNKIKTSEQMKVDWKNNRSMRLAATFKGNSQERRNKISVTMANKIAQGEIDITRKHYKTGYYNGQHYDSSLELSRMMFYDDHAIPWTKKHGIVIAYIDATGKTRRYIPDFKTEQGTVTVLEETKGLITDLDVHKAVAAIAYCKQRNWKYRFLHKNNFELIESLSWC